MASKSQNKPPTPASPSNSKCLVDEVSVDKRRKIGFSKMVGPANGSRTRQAFSVVNGGQDLAPANGTASNAGSDCGSVEFTREEVEGLLIEKMKTKNKFNLKEKCDQMMEYIKRLRLCIKWFQELEGSYLLEQEKLRNLLEMAEKKCSDMGMIALFYFNGVRRRMLHIQPLQALNQLCDIIMEPLRDRVVTGLLQASLDGLYRVIVDGGPSRVFSPFDAKLLEEDLEVLKEFFISGGDGLPRGVVENHVARVRQVVKLHGCETRELIENLKSSSGLEMQGGKSKLGIDTQILLRILCHRSDSEASQFLKKQYKIPKSAA